MDLPHAVCCPYCSEIVDDATKIVGGKDRNEPKAGDILICAYCINWLKMTPENGFVKLTETDYLNIHPVQFMVLLRTSLVLIDAKSTGKM